MNAPAAERVPSFPNWAVLCLLFTPAVHLLVAGFMMNRTDDGMGPPPGEAPSALWLWLPGLACLAASLPLAARLSFAPHLATAIVVGVWLLDAVGNSRPGAPLNWIAFGGIALAWMGRKACTRDWDASKAPGWALQGYRRLLRGDRWAALRVIVGVALFLGGIFFMIATGNALKEYIPLSRPVAKFLAIPAFLGAFLAGSGMAFSEAREPEEASSIKH
jgi:hypothetical protein